jgi:CRISPR-associated protein Csy2
MSQFILINRVKVQSANAVAGFTWGFPAITHFLGYVQNLSKKLSENDMYSDLSLSGCAVVAHEHQVHTYRPVQRYEYPKGSGKYKEFISEHHFLQNKNPAYLQSDVKKVIKGGAPSIIEEGKMDMTVSLLLGCEGNIGNREEDFKKRLTKNCLLQRLAGGTILDISNVEIFRPQRNQEIRAIAYKLLPGFLLMDRSSYLEQHFLALKRENPDAELLDAWLDFSAIKQKARPKSDLISKHLQKLLEKEPDNPDFSNLVHSWQQHLSRPYKEGDIPDALMQHFDQLEGNKANKKLKTQWRSYCHPDEKTDADWEYMPKPQKGYLVPIMTGYKAISEVYKNHDVKNTRDNETDVCFVESVHSIGEWLSVHHIKTPEQLQNCLWHYHYEENWYLCKQEAPMDDSLAEEYNEEIVSENPEDDF